MYTFGNIKHTAFKPLHIQRQRNLHVHDMHTFSRLDIRLKQWQRRITYPPSCFKVLHPKFYYSNMKYTLKLFTCIIVW